MQHVLRNRLRQLLILLAISGLIGFSVYAEELPLLGRYQLSILRDFDLLLTPNALTFLAWIPVFAGLIAYATYQSLPRQTGNGLHNRLLFWLLIACAGHAIWLYCWHLGAIEWALFGVILQLDGLMAIYMRLGIGRITVRRNETLFVRIPISLYLGWTSVVATLTVTAYLTTTAWTLFGIAPSSWLLIVMSAVTILIGIVAMRHHDFVLALVWVWMLSGVALSNSDNLTAVLTAVIMSAALLLAVAATPADQRPITLR